MQLPAEGVAGCLAEAAAEHVRTRAPAVVQEALCSVVRQAAKAGLADAQAAELRAGEADMVVASLAATEGGFELGLVVREQAAWAEQRHPVVGHLARLEDARLEDALQGRLSVAETAPRLEVPEGLARCLAVLQPLGVL